MQMHKNGFCTGNEKQKVKSKEVQTVGTLKADKREKRFYSVQVKHESNLRRGVVSLPVHHAVL